MWLVLAALRRPIAVMVVTLGIALAAALAITRMPRDIFPELRRPIVYFAATWPGMTARQMEGLMTSRFEYHQLYIAGVEHIESSSIGNLLLIKLFFYPDVDTSYAVAQTVAMSYRSTAQMPPGTYPPFIMRLDAGAFPIAQLVFESKTRTDHQIHDLVASRIRPMLATMKGVSAPPPFGGTPRMIMVSLDPKQLQRFNMTHQEVADKLAMTNLTLPQGTGWIGDRPYLVEGNLAIRNIKDLDTAILRTGDGATVYLKDVGKIEDATDIVTNSALMDGQRAVYMPVTKRSGASTLSVIEAVRASLPEFRAKLPPDVNVRLEFDQSTYVLNAITGLLLESIFGAILTGLAVLLFVRDWRSALVVIISIPTSLLVAVVVMAVLGETINIMTLGGLALAVGILVDEATVAIENVNVHLAMGKRKAVAVRDAMREVQLPRLVAMLCICAVFIPSFYMVGTPRALFGSLSLAVGLAMVSSYFVTSTLVPVVCVWVLRPGSPTHGHGEGTGLLATLRRWHAVIGGQLLKHRYLALVTYVLVSAGLLATAGAALPRELFPRADAGYLQLRVRGPQGSPVAKTEQLVRDVVDEISKELGPGGLVQSLANVGVTAPLNPASAIYTFNSGSHEALLLVELAKHRSKSLVEVEEALRPRLARQFPDVGFSFEPADVVSQVLNVGAPNTVDIVVTGKALKDTRAYAETIRDELAKIPGLRDLSIPAPLDMPAVKIEIDRERAAQLGVMPAHIGRTLATSNWSSQMLKPLYWVDPSGNSYFVSARTAEGAIKTLEDLKNISVSQEGQSRPLLRDVATFEVTKTQAEFPHWNSRRCLRITANSATKDLARLATEVRAAIVRAGKAPDRDMLVLVRGEIQQMEETLDALQFGFGLAVVVVVLLLTATFQSFRSAFAILFMVPAVLAGVVSALWVTNTSLNIQSAIGAIMAIGVAVANSVLLVQFFTDRHRAGAEVGVAAAEAATGRFRPILMTSLCMLAGMTPMVLAIGEAGEQNAPLGRAVTGGLIASTFATLFILPAVLSIVHGRRRYRNASLDVGDPASHHFVGRETAPAVARESTGGA